MTRPQKPRWIEKMPTFTYFKPKGVPLSTLEEVVLSVEDCEALRLKDVLGLEQTEAAKRMKIHQSTFHRMLIRARQKISDAIINGKAIRVEGGAFKMPGGDGTGPAGTGPVGPGGRGRGQGRGLGRGLGMGAGGRGIGGGVAAGPGGVCKCPSCGFEQPHQLGVPCISVKCPKCSIVMSRA